MNKVLICLLGGGLFAGSSLVSFEEETTSEESGEIVITESSTQLTDMTTESSNNQTSDSNTEEREKEVVIAFKTDYEVTSWVADGNKYTVNWDQKAYIAKYGEQDFWTTDPFVFTYDARNDSMGVGSMNFKRKETAGFNEDDSVKKSFRRIL